MTFGKAAMLAAVIGAVGALADASAQTIEFGRQPDLVRAAQLGDIDGVRAMLQRGESPNVTDTEGRTLLMHAISTGNPGLVALILDFDPLLETADRAGNAALHWAAETGDAGAVTALIDAGTVVDNTNRQGMTPLMMAVMRTLMSVTMMWMMMVFLMLSISLSCLLHFALIDPISSN